jgi:hypothetical protein
MINAICSHLVGLNLYPEKTTLTRQPTRFGEAPWDNGEPRTFGIQPATGPTLHRKSSL